MLSPGLAALRERLDALKDGAPHAASVFDRALASIGRPRELRPMPALMQLDQDFDAVGVHTIEDARLLKSLGVTKGRAGELARGLTRRAAEAMHELEEALRAAERAALGGEPIAGASTLLDDRFERLARAVKVADVFREPGEHRAFELLTPRRSATRRAPQNPRVAVARFWTQRARANARDLVQRRRDLDAAHELLLRVGSGGDREEVRRLRIDISDARARSRGTPAVRSVRDLLVNVKRQAASEPQTAYQALRGIYDRAVEAQDAQLAEAAFESMKPLLPELPALRDLLEDDDGQRERALALGPQPWRVPAEAATQDDRLLDAAFELNAERVALFELAEGCARFFDVEDTLAEEVIAPRTQRKPRVRRVPYPTQTMIFERSGSVSDLGSFVISDPRTLLYDVAAGRQTIRAFIEDEAPPAPRKIRRSAVRVYVCDASGSMHGPRARFRDALLVAELNNLRLKALQGQPFDPLYFSFFNDSPSELVRVDTAQEARRQMERLFAHSPAEGQTDIALALIAAFDSIRAAHGRDPALERATVVLVTDGEDRVDSELVRKIRAPVGSIEISLSFISLGEENTDLRGVVLEQRAQGSRAFYFHLSDREIGAARTEFDRRWRTLLPASVPVTPVSLETLLPHLAALERIAAGEHATRVTRSSQTFDALFPSGSAGADGAAPNAARGCDLLDAVCEAASLALPEDRANEATVLLEHLLTVYGISMQSYLAMISSPTVALANALERLRLLCRPLSMRS